MPERYDLKQMLEEVAEEKAEVQNKKGKMTQEDIKKMLAQKGGKK
jgi:hypothetical protein